MGWCTVDSSVVEGHRTATFPARAARAEGTIVNDDAHPLIRFIAPDGTDVVFRQNGGISRAVSAAVPVAYDPVGTAQADTLSARGEVAGLAWLGLGFTLFPLFGARRLRPPLQACPARLSRRLAPLFGPAALPPARERPHR